MGKQGVVLPLVAFVCFGAANAAEREEPMAVEDQELRSAVSQAVAAPAAAPARPAPPGAPRQWKPFPVPRGARAEPPPRAGFWEAALRFAADWWVEFFILCSLTVFALYVWRFEGESSR